MGPGEESEQDLALCEICELHAFCAKVPRDPNDPRWENVEALQQNCPLIAKRS